MNANGRMKYALVGLGYWGPKLLRNLVDEVGAERVVVVDQDPERLAGTCRRFSGLGAYLSLDDALADDAVGAVVLATPVETHAPLGRKVLDRGRHLLVEKPLAASVDEAFELVELAQINGLTLMVGHTFLFSPRVHCVAELVRTNQIGAVRYATSSRLNLGLYRPDTNVIWDLAPHDFSILFHVLGMFPVSVQTVARSIVDPDIPEVAFMTLTFATGTIASVTVSWLAPRKVRHTVVVGDQRMVVYDDDQHDEPVKVYDKGIVLPESPSFGESRLTYRYGDTVAPHVPASEPLALEVEHFVACVERAERCRSDGWFGLAVVDALEAADRSWRAGGLPVTLTDAHARQADDEVLRTSGDCEPELRLVTSSAVAACG